MTVNLHLLKHSTITISGLTGTNTPSSNLSVISTPDVWGGKWNKDIGQLELTYTSDATIAPGTPFEFSVDLVNSYQAREPAQTKPQRRPLRVETPPSLATYS